MTKPPRLYLVLDDPRFFRPFMTDFFKVMRNHRIACTVTMQQEEQWDLMDLAPMKNVIGGLLAFKMYYRPETIATAEKMALVLNEYDAMGDTRPYMTRAKNASKTNGVAETEGTAESDTDSYGSASNEGEVANESDGWQIVPRADEFGNLAYDTRFPVRSGGHARSHSSGDSASWGTSSSNTKSRATTISQSTMTAESETENLHIVGPRDQVFVDAQHLLSNRMHRHDAVVRWEVDGKPRAEFIHVKPFPRISAFRMGRPVLQQYRDAVARYTKRSQRPPYVSIAAASEMIEETATTASPSAGITASAATAAPPPTIPDRRSPLTFPPRPGSLTTREMRQIATLDVVAAVHLCSVQQLMMLLDFSYDTAHRELNALEKAGLVDSIKRFAPRGKGSVPLTFIITAAGAKRLAEYGRPLNEIQRVAKNLAAHRRAVEENRPTQERHRTFASTLLTLLISAMRRIDSDASIANIYFDRERMFPVDLTPFASDIGARERTLISPDPTKTTVSYAPDFFFEIEWRRDGQLRREPVFGEIENGYGERSEEDLAVGKAWKMRALMHAFERTRAFGEHVYAAGTTPRIVVWSRTAALEQGFFDGARSVFKDAKSPLWLTNGEILPLSIPVGTKKKDIAAAIGALIGNVQTPVWRWLRFTSPTDRRRFVGIREAR